ncbi:MAG TPA: gamma-glutamylcyclotransferase family protein, partial [Spirochaetota bacterium]
ISRLQEMIIFVYGTLRSGTPNHYLLSDSSFIGKDQVYGFDLYDAGEYPIAAMSENANARITVEIYEINEETLKRTDRLEEYYGENAPNFYERKLVISEGGTEGFLYYGNIDKVFGLIKIESGDWVRHTIDRHQRP